MAHELCCVPMPLCRRGRRLTFLLLRQKQSKQKKRRPYRLRRFLGSESKFAEPKARPAGAVPCTAAKLASDPNNRNLRCSVQPGSSSNSLRSDNRSPCSVWPSAPQRIEKGFARRIQIRDQIVRRLPLLFLQPGLCGIGCVCGLTLALRLSEGF